MSVSKFIARKFSPRSTLAVVCIAVSFLVMIIAVAVSSGFRREIRDGVGTMTGDVQLLPLRQNYLEVQEAIGRHPEYLSKIASLKEVESIEPVVYKPGLIKCEQGMQGVVFKGIENPSDSGALRVAIPRRLRELLSIEVGDKISTYFIGEGIKQYKFKVSSIYEGIVDSSDKLVVYADIADIQEVCGFSPEEVSAFEIRLKSAYRSRKALSKAQEEIGFIASSYAAQDDGSVYARSSESSYPQLFDWLDLLDFNVLFILILMTIVAGFNMISGLLIILFENISTIGLLKALGMTDRDISKVFLLSSSKIVLIAMAAGNALALLFCLIQGTTHLIPLNPENYFVSFVPVSINVLWVLAADLAAYLVIMLLLLIPLRFISKVDPAQTVRVN